MYDLAVAYRIYPKVSGPAKGLPFSDDKLMLAEICLRSFKKSLGSLRVKIWAILDGCPQEYHELFRRYFPSDDLIIVSVEGMGSWRTITTQIDILVNQTDAEAVYFAEDDYVYLPGEFQKLLDMLWHGKDVEFVTAYDHPDDYYLEFHRFPKMVQFQADHHWRSAASTCHTFLAKKSALIKYQNVFRQSKNRVQDSSQWMSITGYRVFDIPRFIRYVIERHFLAPAMAKAWIYCWKQILFGKRARLWVPMPSIGVHLTRGHPAPGFDLEELLFTEHKKLVAESSEPTGRA